MGISSDSKFNLELLDLTYTATIPHAPSSVNIELKPPVGEIYEIVYFSFRALDPAGSAAGTHDIQVFNGGKTSGVFHRPIYVSSNTGSNIVIGNATTFSGTTSEPSNAREQMQIIRGTLWASNDLPITLIYTNSTDVDQAGDLDIFFLVKKHIARL